MGFRGLSFATRNLRIIRWIQPCRVKKTPSGERASGEEQGTRREESVMKKAKSGAKEHRASGKTPDLRAKAERRLAQRPKDLRRIPPEDVQGLLHELQVHQTELEMQNDELRKAQGEIEESRSRLADLFDFAPIPYFTFDGSGMIIEVNFKGAELLGLERAALIGKAFTLFVLAGDRDKFRKHKNDTLRLTSRQRCELKVTRKDGTVLDAVLESIAGKNSSGEVTQVRSALWDVTELSVSKGKIRAEQAFRETIENSIRLGLAAFDYEGRITYANPAFCRMVGWSQEELIGTKPPFPYWPQEERKVITDAFLEVFSHQKTSREYELRFQHRNGRRFDSLVIFSELVDMEGESLGWLASFGDITERKKREEEIRRLNAELEEKVRQRTVALEDTIGELKRAETELQKAWQATDQDRIRLRTILETIPSGVIITEKPDGRISYVNSRGLELYGRKPRRGMKMDPHSLDLKLLRPGEQMFPPEELPARRALLHGETVREEEILIEQQDGQRITVLAQAAPLRNPKGEITGAVGIFHDITLRKRAELEVQKLNEELTLKNLLLEQSNQELDAYASTVSHDLKNPLVIMGNVTGRLIKKYGEEMDDRGKEYLQLLHSTCGRMNELVDALLELARVSKSPLKIEKVDLSGLVESVLSGYREQDPARKVEPSVARGLVCRGDRRLLGAVLENLLSNSWKFTRDRDPARIEFGTLREGPAPAYFIRDNGCGFAVPKDTGGIFLPFQRFHNPEEYPGMGIGLATVNRVIIRHGGKVWLQSAEGKGTTVFFTLPEE
jgi:PAS domain S-box-containing protein